MQAVRQSWALPAARLAGRRAGAARAAGGAHPRAPSPCRGVGGGHAAVGPGLRRQARPRPRRSGSATLVLPHLDAAYNLARYLARDADRRRGHRAGRLPARLPRLRRLPRRQPAGLDPAIVRNCFHDWARERQRDRGVIATGWDEAATSTRQTRTSPDRRGATRRRRRSSGADEAGAVRAVLEALPDAVSRGTGAARDRGPELPRDRRGDRACRSAPSCRGWRGRATRSRRVALPAGRRRRTCDERASCGPARSGDCCCTASSTASSMRRMRCRSSRISTVAPAARPRSGPCARCARSSPTAARGCRRRRRCGRGCRPRSSAEAAGALPAPAPDGWSRLRAALGFAAALEPRCPRPPRSPRRSSWC